MIVKVASSAGFCNGVKKAFESALKLTEKYETVYTFGELVHNGNVTKFLQSKGVNVLHPDEIHKLKRGDAVLIRAHGVTPETEAELKSTGADVYDATCSVVKHNQLLVKKLAGEGRQIVVVGDLNHDEVSGLVGYAGEKVKVLSENSDLPLDDENCAIVFQTTITAEKFDEISRSLDNLKKINSKTVGIYNTICYTTKARQDETKAMAKASDAVLVLGSRNSANTLRLFNAAKALNQNTFFADNLDEAKVIKAKDFQCISIVAGASTPPWLIQEVTEFMSDTQMTAVPTTASETEVKNEATLQEEKKVEAPAENNDITMEDVMASSRSAGYTSYRVGKRIKGTVIRADETGVYLAIGGKKDGFIEKAEVTADDSYNSDDYHDGDEIEAVIVNISKDYVALSKKQVDIMRAEEAEAEKALASGEFSLKMTEVVKGGLRGKLGGYTIFVPASQIKIGYVKNLEDYKDKTLRLTIMPPKAKEVAEGAEEVQENKPQQEDKPQKKSRYLFASQRMILEKEKKEKEDAFWESIHVHDIVVGKVKRFTAFGAFVNVRGFDCLAHISELSWNKITDPASVLKIGESYDFVVLKMDRETGKISLGYKQLQKKPYEIAAEQFPVGTVIKGKVERIFPYGAFVSITEGVDGLVHVSQISHNWIKDANEALKVGDEVDAKIIGFEDNRITLSIKELLPVPEASEKLEDAETEESEASSTEKPKRQSRVKKFEQKLAEGEYKRERYGSKKESSSEPKEWVSGSSNATLGDLFKGLDLNLDEEEEPKKAANLETEEAPKKVTKKKAAKTEEE